MCRHPVMVRLHNLLEIGGNLTLTYKPLPTCHTYHQQVSPTCMQADQAYIKSHAVDVVKFSIYEVCKTSDMY